MLSTALVLKQKPKAELLPVFLINTTKVKGAIVYISYEVFRLLFNI